MVCAVEKPSGLWVIQDITLKRQQGTSAGILLRHADEGTQMVESVQQNSPAQTAGLRKNDILLAVNGTYLNSGQQAAKLFSTTNINGDKNSITVRIKRLVQPDPRKVVAEPKTMSGSDGVGSGAVVGEDTSGDVSGSGKSTPDSSHNNSPELKRKLLDLHSFPTTTTTTTTNNNPANNPTTTLDKSPVSSSTTTTTTTTASGKGSQQQQQKNVSVATCQEKSTGSNIIGQNSTTTTTINEKPPSNQSSKAGTPTSPEIMSALNTTAEKRALRRHHTTKNKMHLKILQTPFVDGSCDPVFDSDFEFWLEEENKYMSIAVWSRNISSKPEFELYPGGDKQQQQQQQHHHNKRDTHTHKDHHRNCERDRRRSRDGDRCNVNRSDDVTCGLSDDTLVAFMNLALVTLIPDTTLTSQGHVTKLAVLTPPHPKCPEMATDSLVSHKGFNPNLCYGDITLSLTYQPKDRCEAMGRSGGIIDRTTTTTTTTTTTLSEDESMTDGTLSEEEDSMNLHDTGEDRSHEFKRTHFHSATQCDFCKKKIWLKDAYQCSECGIICHKKCMVRCEQQTTCDAGGVRYKTTTTTNTTATTTTDTPPEIITTAEPPHSPATTPPASPQSQRRTLSSLFAQVASASKGSLKRAGSAHNLAPPNPSPGATQSRSLPPSPPHSPQHNKVSIWEGSNPFVIELDEGDTIQGALDRLLSLPHDERLVTLARDSARDLHSLLPTHQRIAKINQTLCELQSCIDSEGEVRMSLARQEREASVANDSLTRASVALQISQCDARTQALALLTLHYCTALQCCNAQPQQGDGNSSLNNTGIMKQQTEG
ncbi:hypothetical protein Pmani_028064 [Petrolisthes manimaculis]|uniref:Uncharacterized protein n=1 Tax=Petrolisthes manimaculis TaxID=1843537 RepID=A0AAE1P063_9EUCA|nr:hypothetical protein Pmani_028064 [Petrolisthes manimaculis]